MREKLKIRTSTKCKISPLSLRKHPERVGYRKELYFCTKGSIHAWEVEFLRCRTVDGKNRIDSIERYKKGSKIFIPLELNDLIIIK